PLVRPEAVAVSVKVLVAAWNDLFFAPRSTLPLGLFRILYGLCVAATLLLLRPDWEAWYGGQAWITSLAMRNIEPGPRLNVFNLISQEDSWIDAVFWLSLLFATFL